MKHYQSLMNKQNKFQSIQNHKGLQPIMEYDYYFQSIQNQPQTKNNIVINTSKNGQKISNKKTTNKSNLTTQNNPHPIKRIKKTQQLNNKLSSTQNRQNQHFTKRNNQKSPLNNKNTKQSNIKAQKIMTKKQIPQKQTKILSQHNQSTYSSNLFPQAQSIKQKLKQNLQQQMLNNYYINKYSTIMSKMTNQNIKIELPPDLTQRSSFSNTKDKESLMGNKKRKNFKQVMRQKATTSKKDIKLTENNQLLGIRNRQNNYLSQTQDANYHQIGSKRDQSLLITFSPIKTPMISKRNDRNPSQQTINVKSLNKNHKNKQKQKLTSSRHSHYSHNSQRSHSYQDKSLQSFSPQKQTKNQDSLRQSQKIRESSHSFRTNYFQSRQHSPQNRLNFKQSLKQKKSLHLEYQQNYDLYKKLQSSIIDELYSPSPRKIEKEKFKEITFVNRQMTKQEKKLIKLNERQGIRDFYDEGFQNIEINQDVNDFDKIENQMEKQQQGQTQYKQRIQQIDLLRQSIRKSIQSSRSYSQNSSPRKGYERFQQKKSPSSKTPNDSPQRSFISNKHKHQSSQGSIQNKEKWNPHFNSVNSHNKKYLNTQLNRRNQRQSPSQSPDREQRKYHSLQKTYSPKTHKIQPLKRLSSKLRNFQFSQQQLPINQQENQIQSDLQNNLQTTIQHNLSYNEVAKVLGNSMDLTEDAYKHVSFKPHQRKGSFHSARSDRNHRIHQAVESRFIIENFHNSRNSNETVNDPSQQEEDVEFVPAADQNLFSEKGSQRSKQKNSSPARKNLIETVGYTRSRKPSQHFSFISDSNSHHDFSMLSRFSMTSQEGSMIINKLENEITENQFGPYQHALQSLRQLLYQHKTAWPIYVVGQKILDDRTQYEKKIDLQSKMIEDYKQKIVEMKRKQEKYQKQTDQLKSNQIKILKLIRSLCSEK